VLAKAGGNIVTKKPVKPLTAKASAPSLTRRPTGYAEWLADVKERVRAAQQRAALAVNHELLRLYWGIGRDILARQVAGHLGPGQSSTRSPPICAPSSRR
jgi:hypothetical protein